MKVTMNNKIAWIAALVLSQAACVEVGLPASGNQTFAELNPVQDMHASPSFKDQEMQLRYDVATGEWVKTGMRVPPSETIHVAYRPYRFKSDPEAAKQLLNPVAMTEDSLKYGKLLFETNCLVCHGATGQGDGYVVSPTKYPVPPVLTSARLRNWEDAEIYHVISNGQGRMWSYKNNLYPLERWAIVNYVRVLQRADYPEPQDLERIKE